VKVSSRITAPVVLALLCAGVLIVFLWWQIARSTVVLRPDSPVVIPPDDFLNEPTITAPPQAIDPRDQALVHLRQGDLSALKGDWKGAQKEYKLSVEANGGLPALRKLATAQLQRRDIEGVHDTIKNLKSAGARPEDLLLLESIVELRTGELVKARDLLSGAPDSPQKHYSLALLSLIQGDHETAQAELALVAAGWEPVLRSYAKTLQAAYDEFALFPEGSELHLVTLLSRALAQVQECELALPLLIQVTNGKDDYRDAWIVQGYCELTTERSQEALASLEHAYNLDPQKPEIQYFLGRAYAALLQHGNAITFFEYALVNGFEPKAEVRGLIAEEALSSGDTKLALEQLAALTEDSAATLKTFEDFVSVSITAGNDEEAYVKALAATRRWSEDPRAFELLGTAALETSRDADARTAFEKALQLDPTLESAKKKLEGMK